MKIRKKSKSRPCPSSESVSANGLTSELVQISPVDRHQSIGRIYRLFKKISGGADGSVAGVNGSIRPSCLANIFSSLGVDGCEFLDFGAGDGRVLIASISKGATKAYGYELPENGSHRLVLNAVLKYTEHDAISRLQWISQDINHLFELPGSASCAFSFWVGIPLATQEKILHLCAASPMINSLAVFKDMKWRQPDDGLNLEI